jgi:hypothetical protein
MSECEKCGGIIHPELTSLICPDCMRKPTVLLVDHKPEDFSKDPKLRSMFFEGRCKQLEKENAELKDRNFMVENFHKTELKNIELKKKNMGYANFIDSVEYCNVEEAYFVDFPHSTKTAWGETIKECYKDFKTIYLKEASEDE